MTYPRTCAEKDDMGSSTRLWEPQLATAPLTATFAHLYLGAPSAAAALVNLADHFTSLAGPFMAEGPAAMLEMIQEEPTGAH